MNTLPTARTPRTYARAHLGNAEAVAEGLAGGLHGLHLLLAGARPLAAVDGGDLQLLRLLLHAAGQPGKELGVGELKATQLAVVDGGGPSAPPSPPTCCRQAG